jgi:hypothetical protein
MEIRVLGDFDIAREILLGVTRLFSNPDGSLVSTGPAILLALFLMWSFLKWALDQEKSPFPAKEFVFGIVFWLIFGGGPISPKFNVELTSVRENRFQVIDNVPLLAAVPSWLASNFFGEARELLEDNFSPLHYSTASDERTPDPLSALIKLYDNGAALLVEPYLAESISLYMVECYEVEQELDGAPHTMRRSELDTIPIHAGLWSGVKVTYNFLTTIYYSEANKNGESVTCEDAWGRINTMIASDEFITKLSQSNTSKGIPDKAIADASKMIYSASTHTTPSPLSVQQGLFLSYMMREGLSRTTMETYSDRMMFEAQRKRVIEKAGERNMFLQLMIPIITALETFSFFIAPVMMLLSVMGGVGLKLITKYLMLVLFVNLWGFVKIFVDLFTSLSVERAFSAATAKDPLVFGGYAHTFNEIEGLLAVASSMTVAIPMFSMFLLYGGVHSVMGVMRTLGGGSVDGNMVAPTMGTNQNNGTFQMGDSTMTQMVGTGKWAQSHSISSDAGLGTMTVNSATSGSFSQTAGTAQAMVKSDANAWQQTASQVFASSNVTGNTKNGGESFEFSQMSANQQMSAIAHRLEESGAVEKGKGGQAVAAMVAHVAAGGSITGGAGSAIAGFAARAGLDAKAAAEIRGAWSESDSKKYNEVAAKMSSWSDTDTLTNQAGKKTTYSNMNSESVSNKVDDSASELDSRTQQLNKSTSIQAGTAEEINRQMGINKANTVGLNALDGVTRGNTYTGLEGMYSSFTSQQRERLESLGIGSADELMKMTDAKGGNGRSFASNLDMMDSLLGRGDNNDLGTSGKDHAVQASAYRYAAGLIGDEHKAGFLSVASAHDAVSARISNIETTSGQIVKPEDGKVPSSEDTQNRHGTIKDGVQSDQKASPTKEQMKGGVVAAAGPRYMDNNGTPVNNIQGNKAAEVVEEARSELQPIDVGNSKAGNALLGLANGGIKGIDAMVNGIFGPGLLWGKGEDGVAVQSQFSANGNQSNQLSSGFTNLAQMTQAQIRSEFSDGKPSAAAYAMNDVIMSFQSAGGKEVWDKIPDTEDGKRFKNAVTEFMAAKQEMVNKDPEQAEKMDAISQGRINGSIPDKVADQLIANDSVSGDDKVNMFRSVHHSGAGHIIANTEELNENAVIRDMAGIGESDKYSPRAAHGNAGVTNATRLFAEDEAARIYSAGEYKFENGQFIPGVNRDYGEEVNGEKVSESIQRGINNHVSGAVGVGNVSAASNSSSDVHPEVYALANSQLGNLADRLESAGLDKQANKVREYVTDRTAVAVESGVVVNSETLNEKADMADRIVLNQDTGGIEAYMSAGSNNNSVVNSTSSQLAGAPSWRAEATMVGESEDGRVLFSGSATRMSRHSGESAENSAQTSAGNQVGLVAIQDKFMNNAFNRELAGNNGDVPLTFKTDTGVEFNMVEQQSNGNYLYDGGSLGQFTYENGDTRLMPTPDNPNYASREDDPVNGNGGGNIIYVK